MQNDWIKTQAAQNIIGQFDERRPAWLWSGDGQELIWQNHASRLFMAKQKKCRIKLAKEAVPIKGQVRRLLRLGSIGLASLARVQFLVGNKPVSATCSCLPVVLENDQAGLLIVGVDPIEVEIFDNAELSGSDDIKGEKTGQDTGPDEEPDTEPDTGSDTGSDKEAGLEQVSENSDAQETASHDTQTSTEKSGRSSQPGQLSNLLDRLANNSQLFDPLGAGDEIIPNELKQAGKNEKTASDDIFIPTSKESVATLDGNQEDKEGRAAKKEGAGQPEEQTKEAQSENEKTLWRVRGAGFTPLEHYQDHQKQQDQRVDENQDKKGKAGLDDGKSEKPLSADGSQSAAAAKKADVPGTEPASQDSSSTGTPESSSKQTSKTKEADRVANYNFAELSRILKKRINGQEASGKPQPSNKPQPNGKPQPSDKPQANDGKTLNLSEEMLVLNRLPIGILIFRDQQILFANRAFAALMGSSSISRLRESGLGGLFPRIGNADTPVGPVVSLVKLDGKEVLVDARLQTITWQGGSALMLSASEQNNAFDGEASVKSFTRALAENKKQGYFETNDAGIIGLISEDGARLLGQSATDLSGSSISRLVDGDSLIKFQDFLRQKAQFAGAARPYIELACARKNLEMEIFSQGRAGIVTGYFGIIRPKEEAAKNDQDTGYPGSDSPLLARLSRGIRRPLNTILGFSELIYSEAFGALGNPRYGEYARDIKSAGNEIARLVDEMDEYSRLKSADFVPDSADFDLAQLLNECLRLVRATANKRQVFVRSAISETLPAIYADRASMRQAILNLLASAIDQTPAGGKVILSAQIEDDGSIGVHVRDSAKNPNATSERFVVFSESNSRRQERLVPMKSSMGLALTRSLLAVNDCALHVDPSVGAGTLMSLKIPAVLLSGQN